MRKFGIKRLKILLDLIEISNQKIRESIANIIKEVIYKFDISDKILSFLINNRSNMKPAIKLLNSKNIFCFSHSLHIEIVKHYL